MVVGIAELLLRVQRDGLVSHLSEREISAPEGCGFDLRLGTIARVVGGGSLGLEERETSQTELLTSIETTDLGSFIALEPYTIYLVQTVEEVKLPADLVGSVTPRSTLYRSGIAFQSGAVMPGYQGVLTFGIENRSSLPFRLALGARICHILFHHVQGGAAPYRGQWQGGRMSTPGSEKQI
ncbi:MAG: 2'-deoxycytidine 5'-triphosphate deaminase [Myxococcales bacterium]|nr:2'-deoxycytidine 5'-triphosphate deaminase [Myxococcales bacterium]